MTVTETTLTETITETLRDGALTLSDLAAKLGVLVRDLRTPVAFLERDGALENRLEDREGRTSKVRVFALSERFTIRENNDLRVLAEEGSPEALEALTVASLLHAADLVLPEDARLARKLRKAEIIEAILGFRSPLCSECGSEPVDEAGEVCCPCQEAKDAPAPRAARVGRIVVKRRSRRPSVDLGAHGLEDAALTEAKRIADTARSARAAQRDLALWLIARNETGVVRAEVLRTLLREVGRLSAPNFTINMKKDSFVTVLDGVRIVGWTAPETN